MISGSVERKAGVILEYVNIIAKFLVGIVYTPLMLKILGQSEYGIYSLCASFIGYLTLFNSGINAAYIRYYVQTKEKGGQEELSRLNGMFLKVLLMLALTVFVIGMIFAWNVQVLFGGNITLNQYALCRVLMVLMTVNLSINIINGAFNSVITANEKFIFLKVINLIGTVVVPLVSIPLLFAGYRSVGVISATLCSRVAIFLCNVFFCRKVIGVKFYIFYRSKKLLLSIFGFSGFIFFQQVMDQVNWEIDKLLLARFQGAEAVAVYAIGSQLNTYYILIAGAVSSVFIAKTNQMVARNDGPGISVMFVKTARIIFIISSYIMTGYIFFGKTFIKYWAGSGYENSYYVGLFLMLPLSVSLTQQLGQDIMRAKNKHQLQIVLNCIVCVFNLIISIPLCKRYGAVGGAFGTFLGLIMICIFIQYFYYQKVGEIDMRAYVREMISFVPALAVPVAFGGILIFANLLRDIKTFFVYGVIYTLVYMLSFWKLGANEYEKSLVRSLTKKKRGSI